MRLDPAVTFDSLIIGASNARAVELVRGVIDDPRCGNPLLVIGPSGCGKTQLLLAATNALVRRGSSTLMLRSAAQMVDEYVEAILNARVASFRRSITEGDALLIDGLEDLARRPAAQAEIGAMIRRLVERRRPVLLTATSLAGLDPLVPALRRGKRVGIRLPTLEERLSALQTMLHSRRAQISMARLEQIAARGSTIAEARSSLNRVLELQGLAAGYRRTRKCVLADGW